MDDFPQKLKRWSVSCYKDWLFANQIAGKTSPYQLPHIIMPETEMLVKTQQRNVCFGKA